MCLQTLGNTFFTSPSNNWFTLYFNGHSQHMQLFTEWTVNYLPYKVQDIIPIFFHGDGNGSDPLLPDTVE